MTRRTNDDDRSDDGRTGDDGTGDGRTGDGPGDGPGYAVALLGGFAVAEGDRALPLTAREQRLCALLALHGVQARAVVAGMLWPETDEHRARQNLRAALAGTARQAPGLVRATHLDLVLAPGTTVDVRTFVAVAQRLLRTADGDPPDEDGATDPEHLAALGTAFVGDGTLAGDLLPGWYDDWVLVEAERLRHLRLHALEALSALLADHGSYGLALEVALAAVALDPLRESAHRAVIHVHVSEGNLASALTQHERFRRRLARELRIEPSAHMTALVADLHRRSAGGPAPATLSGPGDRAPDRTSPADRARRPVWPSQQTAVRRRAGR